MHPPVAQVTSGVTARPSLCPSARTSRASTWLALPLCLLFCSALHATDDSFEKLVVAGDLAFERRAEVLAGSWANPNLIREANEAYSRALEMRTSDLEVRVKLLHTLFFEAEYALISENRRKDLYQRGTRLFEAGYTDLALRVGRKTLDGVDARSLVALLEDVDEAGALYFWGAMHWGLWAESFGKLAAVRRGVARKVKELGEAASALDPLYEQGGALRILGRLHHLTPKIPLITGWIDRTRALDLLQRSLELGPEDPLNRAFLAQAIWDLEHDSRRAISLLREVVDQAPRTQQLVEDRRAIAAARDLLNRLMSTGSRAG